MPGDWNEKSLDQLERRVDRHDEAIDDLENHYTALAALPERVVEIRDDLKDDRKTGAEFRREVRNRFDRIDAAHAAHAPGPLGIDWRTVLAVVTGVTVPIAAVLIAHG